MNMKVRTVVVAALVGCAMPAWTVAPRAAAGQDTATERLAALGRLWGYIKHTHPWIGHKTREWDQALVAAIPKVKAATSTEEFARAVDHMLETFGDPATRRNIGNSRPGDEIVPGTTSTRPQPYIEWPEPDLAVVTASDYAAIDSSPSGRADLVRLLAEASKAKAVILDLRRVRDAKNVARIGASVSAAVENALGRLVTGPVPLPPARFAYHQGYAPQTGPYPSYYSGLLTIAGGDFRIAPSSAPRPSRVVFVLNAGSADLYGPLTGLQDQGLAAVVYDGAPNPDAGVLVTNTARVMELPGGITVQVRRGEIVRADGAAGFRADASVASSADGQPDAAMAAAATLARTTGADRATGQPSAPRLAFVDDAYPGMVYPTEEYRLLGLFRFWSAIEHFFPYKELMDQPWDRALSDFIPRMQQARDATEYALAVAELVTRLQDSHGAISSPAFDTAMGTHRPPIRLTPVEDRLVVTAIDPSVAATVALRVGDVVLAVDNEDIDKRRERLTRYLSASTVGALHNSQAREVLRGPRNSDVLLKVRRGQNEIVEVKVTRSVAATARLMALPRPPTHTVLPEGFGYVDLDRLTWAEAAAAHAAVQHTPGLIIDLRGYIDSGSHPFIGAMVKTAGRPVLQISRIEFDGMSGEFRRNTILQPSYLRPGAAPYQGKVAVLISTGTASAAESAAMTLKAIGLDVTYIGAPTTGANGNVTNATLPGNVFVRFSGMDIRHADGRQLQRLGVQPDIEVRGTIEGIAAGRDQVMERAIAFLQGAATARQ